MLEANIEQTVHASDLVEVSLLGEHEVALRAREGAASLCQINANIEHGAFGPQPLQFKKMTLTANQAAEHTKREAAPLVRVATARGGCELALVRARDRLGGCLPVVLPLRVRVGGAGLSSSSSSDEPAREGVPLPFTDCARDRSHPARPSCISRTSTTAHRSAN